MQINTSRQSVRSAQIVGLGIYAALVGAAWVINYPGRLNPDSVDMITQARHAGQLDDWHAPVVTWLWSLFDPILGQPAGALLIQSLLMFVYPAIAVSGYYLHRSRSINAVLLIGWALFLAALVAVTGQVVKDIILVALVLCLLAVLESYPKEIAGTKAWFPLFVLLAFIFLVRPTNFLMLAIAGVIWGLFTLRGRAIQMKGIAIIVTVCAASLFLAPVVNRGLLGAQNAMTERSLIIFDAAGVSTRIKQDLFVELPDWPTNQVSRPWNCYTPRQWDPFAWGACDRYSQLVKSVMEKKGTTFVVLWWVGIILRHPVAYLEHRLSYSYELIRHMNPVASWELPYAVNIPARIDELFGSYSRGIDMRRSLQLWNPGTAYIPFGWAAALVFTRPAAGLALVFCGCSLLWAWRVRDVSKQLDVVLVASSALGVANFFTLMAFGIASEGRYLLVTFVCAVVSLRRITRVLLSDRNSAITDA